MSYDYKREIMIEIAKDFSQKVNLPFSLVIHFDQEAIIIGECQEKNESDCEGKFRIRSLIEKYSYMADNQFFETFKGIIMMGYGGYKDRKDDPNYMEKILTTLEKHPKYYAEFCPRSEAWFESNKRLDKYTPDYEYLIKEKDGVRCIWSVGSDIKSEQFNKNKYKEIPNLAEHMEKRILVDFTYHTQYVRMFEEDAIVINPRPLVGANTITSINSSSRMDKGPYKVKFFEGLRIFELMSYPETCKAVLEYFNLKIDKLTMFGIFTDVVYIEETIEDKKIVTDEYDRELIAQIIMERREKRFEIFKEHTGTKHDLKKVKQLKIEFKPFNSDLSLVSNFMRGYFGR